MLRSVNKNVRKGLPEQLRRTVAEGSVAELNARAGQTDFEETFVQLAFSADERHAGSAA